MWKRVIWMEERRPETMSDVETRYRDVSAERLAPPEPAIRMGGVML